MQRDPIQLGYSTPAAKGAQPVVVPPVSRLARAASICAAAWFLGVVCWWIARFSFDAKGVAKAIAFVLKYLPALGASVSIGALIKIGNSSGQRTGTRQATVALVFNLLWLGIVILVTFATLILHSVLDWKDVRG